jgi:4-hydroxy-3-methylbut-2-enyl diphosphate reductase
VDLTIAAPLRFEARPLRRGAGRARVVVTGLGRRRAIDSARRLARAGAGRHEMGLAVAGVAGGLRGDVAPGTVVVADEVRTADGSRPPVTLPGAAVLANSLRRHGLSVVVGPVVSSRRLVRGAARSELAATGAVAVDMETAWLLDAMRRPAADPRLFAVARVLIDTPTHELFSPAIVGNLRGAGRSLETVATVLEHWAWALGPHRVLLPRPRSFCAGVERAIEIVERSLERYGRPVYVRRQIVHNTHVVRRLEELGAIFVQELDDVPDAATVVFAAHGVSPAVRADAERRELFVIDATCPLVAKVHHEARQLHEQGTRIVLIGHADHEEIVGTLGEVPEAEVVSGVADVAALDIGDDDRVAYLTQTTLAVDDTASVITALRERFPHIVNPPSDDICYATQHRQEAVRAIADACDVVLVVGSANSSNSNRLVEVVRRAGRAAHLIEDETELDLSWLEGASTVGVTAGASAPDLLVGRVVDTLASLGPLSVDEHVSVEETVRFRLPKEVR